MTDTPEQRLSLFEALTGFFIDGTSVQNVPQKFRHIYSIKASLNALFNCNIYSKDYPPSYGFTDVPDIDLGNAPDREKLGHLIRETILRGEPRVKKVVLLDFHRDEKTLAPTCVFAVELYDGCIGRFRKIQPPRRDLSSLPLLLFPLRSRLFARR